MKNDTIHRYCLLPHFGFEGLEWETGFLPDTFSSRSLQTIVNIIVVYDESCPYAN